jgi:hypothetical protein
VTQNGETPDPQREFLGRQPQFTPEQVAILSEYIEDLGASGSPQAEALIIVKQQPGQDARIWAVTGRAILINWKDLLVNAIESLANTGAAMTGGTIGVLGAVGLAITAVKALTAAAIEVDNDEARRIVLQLWREPPLRDLNETTITDLGDALSPPIDQTVLADKLDELSALGIIDIQNDTILKKNRLFSL